MEEEGSSHVVFEVNVDVYLVHLIALKVYAVNSSEYNISKPVGDL